MWLGAGADPKVVQRVPGHASAAMTMDLYGHLIDQNLWDAAKKIDSVSGGFETVAARPPQPPVRTGGTTGARAGNSASSARSASGGKGRLTSDFA